MRLLKILALSAALGAFGAGTAAAQTLNLAAVPPGENATLASEKPRAAKKAVTKKYTTKSTKKKLAKKKTPKKKAVKAKKPAKKKAVVAKRKTTNDGENAPGNPTD
jgi:outer membrane biosynthesis protein TonB